MPASNDPFASKVPQSKRPNPRRFPVWIFAVAFFAFWMNSLNIAWRGAKGSPPVLEAIVGLIMGLFIVLQIYSWTRRVQRDVESLESQMRGLSATMILQAAQLEELKKEREHVAS